jgi:hypothetical protein
MHQGGQIHVIGLTSISQMALQPKKEPSPSRIAPENGLTALSGIGTRVALLFRGPAQGHGWTNGRDPNNEGACYSGSGSFAGRGWIFPIRKSPMVHHALPLSIAILRRNGPMGCEKLAGRRIVYEE